MEGGEERDVKETESVEREPPPKKAVPEFYLSIAKILLQLVDKRAQKGVENVTQQVS